MMHPDTTLRWVNDEIGFGVFATKFIPKGTAVYVKDALEVRVERTAAILKNPAYQDIITKYSYVDAKGDYILSWDHARFVNHCCFPASITTGYGFEIAIRDIQAGEEITDDYGLLNIEEDIPLHCAKPGCRKVARANDFDQHAVRWDGTVKEALSNFYLHDQPLLKFFDPTTLAQLNQYIEYGAPYLSVRTQKYDATKAAEAENDILFFKDFDAAPLR
ncbi:MAG: SET domain-containing protein-lysine N-methyltransferase [Proteobacteria bacterium]|nr:MAG: SET domain-containing protein-lysine N-methyltransferase [Pseudomonadota bacterium]